MAWMTYSVKEDSVGLDMWYEWITSSYLNRRRRCTGRFWDSRGVQVVRVQTGGAPSTRTCQGWESPGRKQRWQLKTNQNGVKEWPNASAWMLVESRSRSTCRFVVLTLKMKQYVIGACLRQDKFFLVFFVVIKRNCFYNIWSTDRHTKQLQKSVADWVWNVYTTQYMHVSHKEDPDCVTDYASLSFGWLSANNILIRFLVVYRGYIYIPSIYPAYRLRQRN